LIWAPDAINLAIVRRLGAELATFDERMANCAKVLGVTLTKL
jgi:predicted nucleic acid-binding protein